MALGALSSDFLGRGDAGGEPWVEEDVCDAKALMRLFARVQVKEDYTEGEQVDNLTLVWLLIEDFRSHVGWGSG